MAKYCPDKQGPALYLECNECAEKNCECFFCLVVGSRSFTDYAFLKNKLDKLLKNHKSIAIVSGGADGTDRLAERYAKEHNYPLYVIKPNWQQYGKAAGPIRNEKMQTFIASFPKRGVIAFWDGKSRGTATNFRLAQIYNNDLILVRV